MNFPSFVRFCFASFSRCVVRCILHSFSFSNYPPISLAFINKGIHHRNTNKMQYHQLGRTDMLVSELSLGGASLGGVYNKDFDERRAIQTVHDALRLGINFIDTSPYYGLTKAEEVRLGLCKLAHLASLLTRSRAGFR